MVQIFADVSAMRDGLLAIGGSDYNHIRNVLRMHPGEELTVRTGDEGGEEYLFEIVSFTDAQVNCRLLSVKESESELPVRVLLFQGLPKSDKMDFIIQKSVEMGAAEIIPVEMHRSIVKLTGDKRRKRIVRWQAIAESAAKQSKRAVIPQVQDILSMKEALEYAASRADVILLPYEAMAEEKESGPRAYMTDTMEKRSLSDQLSPEKVRIRAEVNDKGDDRHDAI